jgi:hypothetical protein
VRVRGTIAAVLFVGALAAVPTAFGVDRGKDRPPTTLTEDFQAIWMTEWSACWTSSMKRISNALHIPVKSGMTPQQAANKLSKRAVKFLYETTPELRAGADGCRNGILWRYYHPQS